MFLHYRSGKYGKIDEKIEWKENQADEEMEEKLREMA